MDIRQSHLQTYNRCAEAFRLQYIVGLKGRQSAAVSYGTVLHFALQTYWLNNKDIDLAKQTFDHYWKHPELLGCAPDYFLPRTSWSGYNSHGFAALDSYHEAQITWSATDKVLGVEIPFRLSIANGHTLTGTMDLLRYTDQGVLNISDWKTGKTKTFLRYDVQFTAYIWATLQDDFWLNVPNGEEWREFCRDKERTSTWIDLKSLPFREVNAGKREAGDFVRLEKACDNLAKTVDADIYVPTLSGDSCGYCDFYAECGLPEGNLISAEKAEEISFEKDHFNW